MSKSFLQQAREIRQQPSIVETFAPVTDYESVNEDNFWPDLDVFRPELYAISAVIAELTVDRAIEQACSYPEFTVDTRLSPLEVSFWSLAGHLRSQLAEAAQSTLEELSEAKSPILARLERLCQLFEVTDEARYTTPEKLILAGTGTAGTETAQTLRAARTTILNHAPQTDPEEVAEIALNSRRLIRRVASVNIEHLSPVASLIRIAADRLPDDDFHLKPLFMGVNAVGKRTIDFTRPILQYPDLVNDDGTLIGDIPTYLRTIGCPARARLNGHSSVDKVWDWAVSLAYEAGLFEPGLQRRQVSELT